MTRPDWQVLQRGWLSSNNVLLRGAPGEGALLVDSGHALHAGQTVALLQHALASEPLREVVNTHLHSDHCGGNARLQAVFGATVAVPAPLFDAVQRWDGTALSFESTGQQCERFTAQRRIAAGDMLAVGARRWHALATPGHDPDMLMLFDSQDGVLLSADALWEDGFGIVFPELVGEPAFEAVGASLDLIERLAPRTVVPGHGRPFTDLDQALARARSRLQAFAANPQRHARHAGKALLKYHLMEVSAEPLETTLRWLTDTPVMQACQRGADPHAAPGAWAAALVDLSCRQGLMTLEGATLRDTPVSP